MHEAVLTAIEAHALTPEAVEAVLVAAERTDAEDARLRLRREAKTVETRIARLVVAIEAGVDSATVAAKLRDLEARKRDLDAALEALRPVPRLPVAVVEDRLAEWRRLLRSNVCTGRMVLDRVLAGSIVFTPVPESFGYTFEAPTRFDRLFSGLVVPRAVFAATWKGGPGVAEPIRPEDVYYEGENDVDYGRILERAYRNRTEMASPPGFDALCTLESSGNIEWGDRRTA